MNSLLFDHAQRGMWVDLQWAPLLLRPSYLLRSGTPERHFRKDTDENNANFPHRIPANKANSEVDIQVAGVGFRGWFFRFKFTASHSQSSSRFVLHHYDFSLENDRAARINSRPLPCRKISFIMLTLAGGAMTLLKRPIIKRPTVANM